MIKEKRRKLMISYDDALKAARKMKGFFDCCTETENAWLFHSEDAPDPLAPGACIVLKKTGEILGPDGYRWHEASRNDWVLSSWRISSESGEMMQ